MFSIIYYILLIIFLIIYGVFISLVWLFTYPFDRKKSIIARTTHYHAMGLFWLCPLWKIEVEGAENIEKNTGYVIVSNHQAMFDIPLLHALKIHRRWVAKRSLIKMPFVGHAMLIHGDILIERGEAKSAKKMMAKALKILKMNVSVAIFPEGTRSRTGKVGRFKEGAFLLAKKADAPILPIVIDGTANAFDGWKLRTPHKFRIKVLPPVSKERVKNTEIKTLTVQVREEILREHIDMRPELYEN
ncbi:MAG: 1-acyl-sn-glycerol-3-phosphate acyltransferase [Rikenellaceae bacterium]|nr:1-acyl-sn-glycerol-3-phosphate acyltransferase [Rikenellaceae bacterium]